MSSKAARMSYRIGRGEQGVLTFEPYKSEILPLWRFKTPAIARQSAKNIYDKFETYNEQDDFVGMDMCRKFLQMVQYMASTPAAKHMHICLIDSDIGYDTSQEVREPCRWKEIW